MSPTRYFYFVLFAAVLLTACGKKKKNKSLSGDDPVEASDFISSFSTMPLPYEVKDSIFLKKDKDSSIISYKIFTQFVADSFFAKTMGKNVKPKIYPVGKVEEVGAGTYLFAKMVAGDKKSVMLLAFDKNEKLLAAMPVMIKDENNNTAQSVIIDKKYAITKYISQKKLDGSLSEGKDVYILNEALKNFTLIMTDDLGEKVTELINPIDTLSRKHKFAGDYGADKMNLLSIRDGKKIDHINFFLHVEKDNGQCTGELKGEAIWKSNTVAEYREDGDPCVLVFTFSATAVSITEENCGSRRNNINCTLNSNFLKKKYSKPTIEKTDKKKISTNK